MAAITNIGKRLLITRGEWRGYTGTIKEIKHLPCGLIDYVMEIDLYDNDGNGDTIEITIQSEDCREYCPGSINLESPFDITSYLSTTEMRNIAMKIYEAKITTYLDDIFNSRALHGAGNIANQVINEITSNYASEMFDKYKDDMLKIFKKVIEFDPPIVDDEDGRCFGRSIQWALEKCASKYIEEHPDELHNVMKDKIHEIAERMVEDQWSYNLNNAIEKTVSDFIKYSKVAATLKM